MNVIYLCDNVVKKGGIERIVITKANYLADVLKYKVTIVTTFNSKEDSFYNISSNIKIIDLNILLTSIKNIFIYKKKVKEIIKNIQPDIIMVPTAKEGILLPFIDRITYKIREIHFSKKSREIQNQTSNYFKKKLIKIYDFIEERIIQKYNKLIVLTEEDKIEWKHKNIDVIYNAKTINLNDKSKLDNKKVISVGRLDYQKGFDRLIDVWDKVSKTKEDWILEIYGDGPLKEDLLSLVKKKKLENKIFFMGTTKKIELKMLESSIYVLTSRHEGLPLVLLEAMACGLPIVSFDCPCGPRDVILNEYNGFLVQNENTKEMAKKIELLINDISLRKKMGDNSKQESNKYTIEKIMKKWDEVINYKNRS